MAFSRSRSSFSLLAARASVTSATPSRMRMGSGSPYASRWALTTRVRSPLRAPGLQTHLIGMHLGKARGGGAEQAFQLWHIPLAAAQFIEDASPRPVGIEVEGVAERAAGRDDPHIDVQQHQRRGGLGDDGQRQAEGSVQTDGSDGGQGRPLKITGGLRCASHTRLGFHQAETIQDIHRMCVSTRG